MQIHGAVTLTALGGIPTAGALNQCSPRARERAAKHAVKFIAPKLCASTGFCMTCHNAMDNIVEHKKLLIRAAT